MHLFVKIFLSTKEKPSVIYWLHKIIANEHFKISWYWVNKYFLSHHDKINRFACAFNNTRHFFILFTVDMSGFITKQLITHKLIKNESFQNEIAQSSHDKRIANSHNKQLVTFHRHFFSNSFFFFKFFFFFLLIKFDLKLKLSICIFDVYKIFTVQHLVECHLNASSTQNTMFIWINCIVLKCQTCGCFLFLFV